MSHAISFYVLPKIETWDSKKEAAKKRKAKPFYLFYYTGGSELYQIFRDNGKDCFCGNDEKDQNYRGLTIDVINELIEDVDNSITKWENNIKALSEFKNPNDAVMSEIQSDYAFMEDLKENKRTLEYLKTLVIDLEFSGNRLVYNTY